MEFSFVAPCHFGLETAAAFDFRRLGAADVTLSDGRVAFKGDETVLADANLWSRCTERILMHLATFTATTFDELFDGIFAIPFEEYIPKNAAFPVKGASLSSTLSSVPACQSIVKKAVVERLREGHGVQTLPEDGALYQLRFSIRKDEVEMFLDTSGDGLHKRGYRAISGVAPLKETLAAAIADYGRTRRESHVQDPFCGSGTLVIEAALKARNIAPGLNRRFAAESYTFLTPGLFDARREAARAESKPDASFIGEGFDVDPEMIAIAQDNARKAGVADCCHFEVIDVKDYVANPEARVFCNPPYGERMGDAQEAQRLMGLLGSRLKEHPAKAAYILSADDNFENHFGKKARRRRKVYNGMIPCTLYMYF